MGTTLKPGKPLTRKTALRKRSPKRTAYMASEERQRALEHMGRVAQLPCLVCGDRPVEVHHMPNPRSDFRVIPLCPFHHRTEYGPQAFHYSARNFYALHGSAEELLERVNKMLAECK